MFNFLRRKWRELSSPAKSPSVVVGRRAADAGPGGGVEGRGGGAEAPGAESRAAGEESRAAGEEPKPRGESGGARGRGRGPRGRGRSPGGSREPREQTGGGPRGRSLGPRGRSRSPRSRQGTAPELRGVRRARLGCVRRGWAALAGPELAAERLCLQSTLCSRALPMLSAHELWAQQLDELMLM